MVSCLEIAQGVEILYKGIGLLGLVDIGLAG
jgi:hypothetical protein